LNAGGAPTAGAEEENGEREQRGKDVSEQGGVAKGERLKGPSHITHQK